MDHCHRQQPSLFDQPAVPAAAPPDQGQASRNETYREIAGGTALQRRYILARIVMAGSGGITLDELSQQMKVEPNKISGRITELKRQGLVVHTKARRMTRAGSTAAVIVAQQFLTHDTNEGPVMTRTIPANELPDGVTCPTTPRDDRGRMIEHGKRYHAPVIGMVKVHYDVDEDQFYFYRPSNPEHQQPVNLLPPQTDPWVRVD